MVTALEDAGYQVDEYATFPGFEITVSRPGGPAPTLAELAAFGADLAQQADQNHLGG